MSKAEQTRQFIIEKSASIFNVKGYDGTSLSDIQKATKFSKGAIYGNFSDKNELSIAAYNYNSSVVFEAISTRIKNTASAKEALLAFPNYYADNWQLVFSKGGCPLMNAAIEADDHLHFMRDIVRSGMKRFIQLLQDVIEEGQAKGEFNVKISAVAYATMIFSYMEGTIMLAKLMDEPKYFQMGIDNINGIVERELMG